MTKLAVALVMFTGGLVTVYESDVPVVTPSAATPKAHRSGPPRVARGVRRVPLPTPDRKPKPLQSASAPVVGSGTSGRWDGVARCESSGNWRSSAGMFEGGLQFLPSTWLAYGGGEYATHAYDATKAQQIEIAERVLATAGIDSWPVCGRYLEAS